MSATKFQPLTFVYEEVFLRYRFFLLSAAIYVLLLFMLSQLRFSIAEPLRGFFINESAKTLLVLPPSLPKAPPIKPNQPKPVQVDPTLSSAESPLSDMTARPIVMPTPTVPGTPQTMVRPLVPTMPDIGLSTPYKEIFKQKENERLNHAREFQNDWLQNYRGAGNERYIRARFTIFQARYRDGDWNCNPAALKNLMLQIRAWSKDRIDANLHPAVLDVGTDELFTIKPPFVYLTGHKDFHFLDSEVRNLRDYLMVGGAIWADSALAGRRSRFDVAFRREIARIMPDRAFQPVGPNHELFNSFFDDCALPSGMNYYDEPLEMINIGEELAVLYSPNGYGHFWESRLNRQGKIEWGLVNEGLLGQPRWTHVYGPHLGYSEAGVLYRNVTDATVRDAYKLGINVVVHLLVRYQDKFKFLPKELPVSESLHRTERPNAVSTAGEITNVVASSHAHRTLEHASITITGAPASRSGP